MSEEKDDCRSREDGHEKQECYGDEYVQCPRCVDWKQRLSQAEAENKVLRDENVAYNKNYLKLMDVAGNVVEALENYMGKFGDCGETYEIARRSLLNWQDVKEAK